MKQYPWKFKLSRNGIEWYQTESTLGTNKYFHYFNIYRFTKQDRQNMINYDGDDKWFRSIFGTRNIGLIKFWYDCPHAVLNLYFVTICWSTPWTTIPEDYWK